MIHGLGNIMLKNNSTIIEVEKVWMEKFQRIKKTLKKESELDNEISIFRFKDRLAMEFKYHIYKYGGNQTVSKYREFLEWDQVVVKFRFRLGEYFMDVDGNEADFDLTLYETHFNSPDRKDVLIINLESLKAIDFDASALPDSTIFSHVRGNYYPNLDDAGNILKYNVNEA